MYPAHIKIPYGLQYPTHSDVRIIYVIARCINEPIFQVRVIKCIGPLGGGTRRAPLNLMAWQ